eukprot:s8362_g2.t1
MWDRRRRLLSPGRTSPRAGMAHGGGRALHLSQSLMVTRRHVWIPIVFLLGLPLTLVSVASTNCVPRSGSSTASSRGLQRSVYVGRTHPKETDRMVAPRISRQAKAVGGPKGKRKDTKKQVQVQKERKKRDNVIELEGKVLVHSRNIFKVLLSNGAEVQCTLAGKLRMNNIKVMEGDAVTVEMSPFDLTKGRIVFRTIKFPGEDEEDA